MRTECRGHGFAALEFEPEDTAGVQTNAFARTNHFDELGRIEWCLWMEAKGKLGALAFDGCNMQTFADGFKESKLQKIFDGLGKLAKAIFQFLAHILLFLFGSDRGDALVSAQAEIFAGDVLLRDAEIHAETDGGTKFGGSFLSFELGHGALEHLYIQIEADSFDVTVLLAAEHVAGAAKFEVESGNAESGTEFTEFLHSSEALAGDFGKDALGRNKEIGVGSHGRTTDAAAELIKFGKAEAIGAVDEDSVGARNVQTVLNDGRGDEDISFIADKLEHDFLEVFLAHLAMSHDDASFGNEFSDEIGEGVDGLNAIVNEIDLAIAGEFIFDGALDDVFIESGDNGLNGKAIARSGFDERHIAQADERHVQGARNGSGGKREGVNIFAHLLEALFVSNTETLLFIDDEEAEVLKLYVFGEQAMGADDNVDFSGFEIGENGFLFGSGAEAA